jgi:hypothetical protein
MPYSVAFDHAGNLFLVGQIGSGPYMSEISGGCSATTVTPLTAGNSESLGGPFAVGVNQNNEVAVLDTDHGYLYTYNHPKHGSLGNPVIRQPVSMAPLTSHLPLPVATCSQSSTPDP